MLVVGCKREPPPTPAALVAVEPSASVIASASSSIAPPPPPREKPKTYGEAMKRGRESTLAKRYDDAIQDFRAAIEFQDTAQAESERGYAQLLAGKLDDASQSLDQALDLSPSVELEAQIEFNVGLVEEKRGHAELARAAFARANAKHASSAAKSKLAAQSQCPASVVREPMAVSKSYLLTTSWRDVYAFAAERGATLLQTTHDWTLKPASDAQARALLVGDAGAPWSINLGHLMFRDGFVYAAPASGGRVLVVDGGNVGGGCTGMGARPLMTSDVALHGSILEVGISVEWWNDDNCKTNKARKTETTTFYDPDATRMITISAPATIAGRTITINAPNCDPVAF